MRDERLSTKITEQFYYIHETEYSFRYVIVYRRSICPDGKTLYHER